MGNTQTIEGRPAVAFFGTSSLEQDLKALEWALIHLPVSDKYKLRIIHVNELKNSTQSRKRPGSRYDHKTFETKFPENYPDYRGMAELQTKLYGVKEHILGVTYEGENFEKALQCAIKEEGLDTLVLACWVGNDTKGPPINTLESQGCSVILANVDSTKLTFSVASTEVSAVTAAAPSSMAPALTDKRSNDATHLTSSKANPNGRETGAATLAAQPTASTKVSTLTTPATAAPTKGSINSQRAPKRSDKAQSTSSGSKTDTRPSDQEKIQ